MSYLGKPNLQKAPVYLTPASPQSQATIAAKASTAAFAAGWLPSMSIRKLLATLVIATALPIVILAFVSNLRLIDREQQVTRDALMSQVVSLASLVESEIDTHIAVTATLASSQLLLSQNLVEFQPRARTALKILPGAWLTVTDPEGRFLTTTAEKATASTSTLVLPEITARALTTRTVQISDVTVDPITGSKAAFIVYPVVSKDAVLYLLYMTLSPSRFQTLISQSPGLHGETVTIGIVDRQRQFIARLPDHEGRIGTKASSGWRDAMEKSASGFADNKTLEGTTSLTAYDATRDGWTVGRSLPVAALNAPMWNTIGSMALLTSVLLGTGLLLGSLIAKQLSRALLTLAKSAHDVGLGHPVEPVSFPVTEATDISDVLSAASKTLAFRQAAVIESEAQFRGTFDNAAVGIAHVGPDGSWLLVNQRLCDTIGYTADELIGRNHDATTYPEDRGMCNDAFTKMLRGELVSQELEKRLLRKDGTLVWAAVTIALRRDLQNEPKYFIVVLRDITERRTAQDHQKFLLGELAHRSKNQLAVIQAIANQTTRSSQSLQEFRSNFSQRLNALAVSTDLLIMQNWSGVPLAKLVERMVHSFVTHPSQIEYKGVPIMLSADAAQAIGLALHELGTNSVKHGAWSQPSGIVTVSWDVEPAQHDHRAHDEPTSAGAATPTNGSQPPRQVCLSWSERNGPPVTVPKHSGFGQVVIEQMVAQKVGGTVEIAYKSEGFSWTLMIPTQHARVMSSAATPLSNSHRIDTAVPRQNPPSITPK
jgi:PAS domain S-box-containing protein